MTPTDKSVARVFDELKTFEKRLANKIIKKGQRAGAKILADEIRSRVPVETGRLKQSIKVRAGKRSRGKTSIAVEVGGKVGKGGDDAFYVGFVEFGSKHKHANPFIKRSSDAVKDKVREAVADAIETEIKVGNWSRSTST